MKHHLLCLLGILTAALLPIQAAFAAEAADADAIAAKLKATGMDYTETSSGLFRLDVPNRNRSQLVFVSKTTVSFEGVPFFYIRATATIADQRPVSTEQMRRLLMWKRDELGHWALVPPKTTSDKWILQYVIALPLSSSADELKAALIACAFEADTKEQELVGEDIR